MFFSAGGIDRSGGDSALIVHVQYGENQRPAVGSVQGKQHSWLPVKIPRWCFGAQNEACRKSTLPRTCQLERNFLQTVFANSHCLSSSFLRGKSFSCICPDLHIFNYLLGVITTCFWHCTVCGLLFVSERHWLINGEEKEILIFDDICHHHKAGKHRRVMWPG